MKICKYCSTRFDDEKKACPACGAEEFYVVMDDGSEKSKPEKKSFGKALLQFFRLLIKAPSALKIVLLVFLVVIVLLTGIIAHMRKPAPVEDIVESKTVELGFKNIGELATQAAFYTNVQVNTGYVQFFNTNVNVPLTKNKFIYSYDGIIKAGLDFGAITYSVDDEQKIVTVNLPEVKILSNEIDNDSFVIYDETKNIFNPLELEDLNEGQKALKEESEEKAIGNGLIDSALANAKNLVTAMCNSVYPDYQVIYK